MRNINYNNSLWNSGSHAPHFTFLLALVACFFAASLSACHKHDIRRVEIPLAIKLCNTARSVLAVGMVSVCGVLSFDHWMRPWDGIFFLIGDRTRIGPPSSAYPLPAPKYSCTQAPTMNLKYFHSVWGKKVLHAVFGSHLLCCYSSIHRFE